MQSLGKHFVLVRNYLDDQFLYDAVERLTVYERFDGTHHVSHCGCKRKITALPKQKTVQGCPVSYQWDVRARAAAVPLGGPIFSRLGVQS